MYHLAKSLYLTATSKEEFSVLLLGLDNAGKTTFHEQLRSLYAPPSSPHAPRLATVPTVGQNVSTLSLPAHNLYLKVWDVGGQLSLRRLWQSYYSSCHAIIFVVDSTDVGDAVYGLDGAGTGTGAETGAGASRAGSTNDDGNDDDDDKADFGRLAECRRVLESILSAPDTSGVPLLVLANKQDRDDCVSVVRIKEGLVKGVFEGDSGGQIRDSRVLPVSALTGTGVKEAVEWVVSRVRWNKEGRPPVMR